MFGWEFPPHILGGLGTASYGLTKGLSLQPDMDITFCIPKPWGDEDQSFMRIIGMNSVPIVWRDVDWNYVNSRVGSYMDPQLYYDLRDHIYADFSYMYVNDLGCMEFSGRYPDNLHEEINNYSIVAGVVARQQQFDIIHAHDWLTYPAGIHAKQVSGKPLVIHVHATDFDRSRGNVNPTVYSIEKNGMDHADCIMCVSELTRQTVINHYHQDPAKCFAMHNAVYPLAQELQEIVDQRKPYSERKEKVVTFLGRITMQKGPEYFIEAAKRVLDRTHNVRFCFAGSGDMMNSMIEMAAAYGIADRCHFPGFMKGKQVFRSDSDSDVHVAYGTIVGEIKEVSRSYKEARMALDVGKIFFEEKDVIAYSTLGIGRLIYQLPIPLCKMFIKEIFDGKSPDEFDEETLTTINKFFENSLNVSETSRQLYIHRNTLVYRLDKLQKATGLDLRVFEDAITFKIALMVVKYMKYMESLDY